MSFGSFTVRALGNSCLPIPKLSWGEVGRKKVGPCRFDGFMLKPSNQVCGVAKRKYVAFILKHWRQGRLLVHPTLVCSMAWRAPCKAFVFLTSQRQRSVPTLEQDVCKTCKSQVRFPIIPSGEHWENYTVMSPNLWNHRGVCLRTTYLLYTCGFNPP